MGYFGDLVKPVKILEWLCDKVVLMDENIFPRPLPFNVIASPLLGGYFYNELIAEIDNCRTSLYSVQYQWKWNVHERFSKVQCLGAAIIRAKARSVSVKVILNKEGVNRNITKINRVAGDALANAGCEVKLIKTATLLHTKLWIFDNAKTFIGSHNVSGRSLTINEEVSVKIESADFASYMIKYFDF